MQNLLLCLLICVLLIHFLIHLFFDHSVSYVIWPLNNLSIFTHRFCVTSFGHFRESRKFSDFQVKV